MQGTSPSTRRHVAVYGEQEGRGWGYILQKLGLTAEGPKIAVLRRSLAGWQDRRDRSNRLATLLMAGALSRRGVEQVDHTNMHLEYYQVGGTPYDHAGFERVATVLVSTAKWSERHDRQQNDSCGVQTCHLYGQTGCDQAI